MFKALKRFLIENSYDPTYINPHGLPTRMDFGPEAKDITEKRERIRKWMKERGIEPPMVQRREIESPSGDT